MQNYVDMTTKKKAKTSKTSQTKAQAQSKAQTQIQAHLQAQSTAQTPKFTPASPEVKLPYLDVFNFFKKPDHPEEKVSFQELGQFIAEQYTFARPNHVAGFITYQDQHAMGPIRAKLKEGMDKISCDYVDLHEAAIDYARHGMNCLIMQKALWTDYDRKLFLHNRQVMLNPPNSWMATVNLEGNSMVTNCYGLTDLPDGVLEKVNGKAILDGGAFIGDTIPVFRNVFPQSVAYCFEPSANNFGEMTRIFKHEIDGNWVKPVQQGLGNTPGSMQLNKVQGAVDSQASLKNDFGNAHPELAEQIQITTVDEFVKAQNLEVGLIKLDIEGFEPEALQGALNTLREQKPMLVIAIYHTPEEFYELKDYINELNLGYKFAIRRSSFTVSQGELVLIAYQ